MKQVELFQHSSINKSLFPTVNSVYEHIQGQMSILVVAADRMPSQLEKRVVSSTYIAILHLMSSYKWII